MRAYGERMHKGRYVLEDYSGWSRNHHKARSIHRWKQPLKHHARKYNKVSAVDTEAWETASRYTF